MNERDSHFAGFAKLLWQEINDKGKFNIDMEAPDTDEIVTRLISQAAYDLVIHVLTQSPAYVLIKYEDGEMEKIPDLTQWPNTSPQSS